MATSAIAGLKLCVAAALFAGALAGCATAPLSPEDWAHQATLRDDVMSPTLHLVSAETTVPNAMMAASEDLSLRLVASIHKRTGAMLWMVSAQVRHGGSHWAFPESAAYMDHTGVARQAAAFHRDAGDVSCARAYCSFDESAAFSVPEYVMSGLAAMPPTHLWLVRLNTQRGHLEKLVPTPAIAAFMRRARELQADTLKAAAAS